MTSLAGRRLYPTSQVTPSGILHDDVEHVHLLVEETFVYFKQYYKGQAVGIGLNNYNAALTHADFEQ